jgi:two-component system phosphate regulon sensor histidine kinase PhoR
MVPGEERRQQYYETITAESERLSRLIGNVLELSRLERGVRGVERVVGPVDEVLAQVVEILGPHARERGFALELRVQPGLPAVSMDRDALLQVLVNLVDNALKFAANAEDRRVVLEARAEGGRVVLAVRDRGPGVPQAQLRRIFQPFYRGERELTRRTKGTGIGLALVQGLVRRMDGEVEARNHPEGGLEVRVLLVSG